jgi:hypothetical protein
MPLVSGNFPTTGEISTIATKLLDFVVTDTRTGVRTIDRGALQGWLRSEIDTQYAWYAGSDAAATKSAYDGFLWQQLSAAVDRFVQAFDDVVRNAGASFPTSNQAPTRAAAAAQLQADAKVYADIITRMYDDGVARIEERVTEWWGNNLLSQYPQRVSRIVDTRIYATTFVTDWDEESAPSPVTGLLDVDQNDTVTITCPTVPSGRNINRWRIYRSSTGSAGTALLFVAELPTTTTTYTDSKRGEDLGEPCPTLTWLPPPTNLAGLVGMPNGVMAGFFDQTVCFCEPFVPYAWPAEYQIPLEFPVVALGVFGQTLVVGTRASPYLISGADSASMSAIKLEFNQACVSKRSMVSVGSGVVYASPDGLCLIDASGPKILTNPKFSRQEWQALAPSSMLCAEHDGVCYVFYTGGSGGCLTVDLQSGEIGTLDLTASAVWVDRITDMMYVAAGTSINAVYGGTTNRTGVWRSKLFRLPAQATHGWLKLATDANATATVRIYRDGGTTPWHTATVTGSTPVRLPAGRSEDWQIEVESTSRLVSLILAADTATLQAAQV